MLYSPSYRGTSRGGRANVGGGVGAPIVAETHLSVDDLTAVTAMSQHICPDFPALVISW